MKRLQNELTDLVNRSVDRHVRLAVTGLSRSGKTAFITSLVNQLLNVNAGARLPLFSAARDKRILGVKRIPHRDLSVPRFAYDEGIASLYGSPPEWPTPTRGVSEIRLKLHYRSEDSFLRHFVDNSSLYVEIVDYPGEWLLDLPMLDLSYLAWSGQMNVLLKGQRAHLANEWLQLCEKCDPLAPVDENLLAEISDAYTRYLQECKSQGQHFIQPGRFVLPGELAGAPALQFFPWPNIEKQGEKKLTQAGKNTNIGALQSRYQYYCEHVVKGFYKDHFQRFDRQIVLVDCLQPLNSGPDAFNDMRMALTQLMRSFHYGKRTLLRRMFSPCIDKLLFAASKADHVTPDQHANLVSLLQQLVQEAWQNAAFEGISMDCAGLASIQATENGIVDYKGDKLPALKGYRLNDGQAMTFYPGDVPKRLPNEQFWQQQGFQFENFRPRPIPLDQPLPHIRMDSALEFLLGDKLK
ncbi:MULTISPECIES: YcjX family GTP-binding protein [Providencia]|uniref:Nucleoside triphosphate hydrolase n=1 Tax=Providencia heimbachae ATCC 35613 TaxID=1354272 RepID=A0A1B7K2Y2_9GAMM|nr:YcjX family protein [Providencia heimbachae]MBP6121157.1 YcjX family protein [Providencia sp.]MDD9338357.1 YcjX family protein [Providencia heimbachae]NIH22949.1 YcjX family protein [Providencia heimbachae]OAT54493.1 nucleoside triphosphate hydrolase [Providencia heimbachae ATCC 35613]QCJ70387.1 YcjX family protein [Providencia heimbachae]